MILSSDDVVTTLALLIPGFVFLSIFYWFGLRVRRTDWRWIVWSLLAAAPIAWLARLVTEQTGASGADRADAFAACGVEAAGRAQDIAGFEEELRICASTAVAADNADLQLAIALASAIVVGVLAALGWRWLGERLPALRARAEPTAWGAALREPRWLEVKTADGEVYGGYNRAVAGTIETEKRDVYLGSPSRISGGAAVALAGVEGVLLRQEAIEWIRVMAPPAAEEAEEGVEGQEGEEGGPVTD